MKEKKRRENSLYVGIEHKIFLGNSFVQMNRKDECAEVQDIHRM
jgi:hypothetical protein